MTALVLLATAVSACASAGGRSHDAQGGDLGVVLGSSGWLHGSLESMRAETAQPQCRAETPSPALKPDDPWLGTIGLKRLLPGPCELGMGVCVPNFLSGSAAPAPADRMHAVGVGVWLKFDF